MTHVTASAPNPNDYIKSDHRMSFSFHPENSSFLSGYLGVNTTTISGILLIRFPHAIEAKEVNLYFTGREKVKDEKIIIVDKHEKLWTTSNPVEYELIKDLTLPFEIQVPPDAIESFESQFGSIRYTLKAVMIRKQQKTTWIEVIVPVWRWSQPSDEELRPLVIRSKAIQQRKHQIEWEAVLPGTFFDIDSKFKVKLKMICHSPDLRVKKINTYLKGIGYKTDDSSILSFDKEQYWYKGEMSGKDIIMIPNGTDTIFEIKVPIDIPCDIHPTCQTKYMKIINEIQIKVIFERSNTYILITKEILVGRNFNTKIGSSD